jgi:hypothetical protein
MAGDHPQYAERNSIIESSLYAMRATKNGWLRGPCPFCLLRDGKKDGKWSFGLNKYTLRYSCFRCKVRGRFPGDPEEAPPAPPTPSAVRVDPPEGFHYLNRPEARNSKMLQPAFDYIYSRGLDDSHIEWADLGACTSGRLRNRVVIPVFDDSGCHWIGWVARAWFPKPQRPYLNLEGPWRGSVIYNGGALLYETDEPFLIVEGAFDTMPYMPQAGAVFGSPSGDQVKQMIAAKRPVVQVPDGDAWQEGWALSMQLRLNGVRAGCIRLPPRTDPDQVPLDLVRQKAVESLDSFDAVQLW